MRIKNLREKATNLIKSACISFLTAVSPLAAMAGASVTVDVPQNATVETLIGSVIGVVLDLAKYVGVILLIFGIYQLYMSFKDDNPDGKIKAITLLVTSVGLMTIKGIMKTIGIIK